MKGFFHIIFLILFIVSCSDKTNNYIDDNDSNDSDSDALTPACEGEWEKRIIQTNKDKFFDFEIVMKKEKWNWFAENNIESISIKEESNIEVRDLYVSNAGDIYFLIDDYEKNRENFLNIYRKNGEIERYYIKSDFSTGMINAAAQIKIRKSQAQKMIFDELNNKLYVLLAFPDKNKDPLDGETKFKPVIAEFISSEEWTFSVLDFTGNTICQNFIKEEEFFFLNCEYYFSIEKFSSSGMYDQAVIIADSEKAYRQVFFSDKNTIVRDVVGNRGKVGFYSFNGPVELSADKTIDSSVLTVNSKSFCEERFEFADMLSKNNGLFPVSYSLNDDIEMFYGNTFEFFEENIDGQNYSWNATRGLLVEKKLDNATKIIKIGSKERPEETFSLATVNDMIYGNGIVFFAGSSTFDIESKGRDWCDGNDKNSAYCYDSNVGAIDENGNVFLRQTVSSVASDVTKKIFLHENYLFIGGENFVQDEINKRDAFVFRIPKSWIISDEAKAKNNRIWIENVSNDSLDLKESVSISSGGFHSCVTDVESKIICWGDNSKMQLGAEKSVEDENDSNRNASPYPVIIDTENILHGAKLISISSGYHHSCAISESGEAYCWGAAMSGQVGDGTKDISVDGLRKVSTEGILSGKILKDISSGGTHTCAIDSEGVVYCWGSNISGQLGAGITETEELFPVKIYSSDVLNGKKIIKISSGFGHTCVVGDNGELFCWGANGNGQIGIGKEEDKSIVPIQVDGTGELKNKKIIVVSSGHYHTCALDEDGEIYCFGNNSKGQLGDGTTEMRLVPVKVDSAKVFKSVSAGFEHSCAVDDAGDAYCWGSNITGQLGNGTKEDSLIPVKVAFDEGIKIKSISCGHRHTCALDDGGKVYCWGWNQDGQLGNGTYDDSDLPVEIRVKE